MSHLFIKFVGMNGSVTAQGYEGWSLLHSLHMNISRPVNTQPGKANDRMKSLPVFSGFTVVKPGDESTNSILQAICSGKIIAKVEVHACTTGANLEPYEKFELENVFISSMDKTVAQQGEPVEQLKLDFTSIRHIYLPRDTTHTQTSATSVGYDLTKGTVL